MLLDTTAARAVATLAAADVPSVLLKGRAIADWLYWGELRDFNDIDLLVDPGQRQTALDVLAATGFLHRLRGAHISEYGRFETELCDERGICIDLHHSLIGVAASPRTCWTVLSAHTGSLPVGGRRVSVLDLPARTMHLVLHAAQNGWADHKAVADLERGLTQLPFLLWQQALDVARDLDALEAFSGGLQLTPQARETALALGLRPPRDVGVLLRIASVPQEALQLQLLFDEPSMTGRPGLVARKVWPTSAYMRAAAPHATDCTTGLLTARLRRAAVLPPRVIRAARDWLSARRAVATTGVQPAMSPVRRICS